MWCDVHWTRHFGGPFQEDSSCGWPGHLRNCGIKDSWNLGGSLAQIRRTSKLVANLSFTLFDHLRNWVRSLILLCPTVRERKFTLTFCSGVSALLFAFIPRENLEIEIITDRTWCYSSNNLFWEKKLVMMISGGEPLSLLGGPAWVGPDWHFVEIHRLGSDDLWHLPVRFIEWFGMIYNIQS